MNQEPNHQHQGRNPLYLAFLIRCWPEDHQWRFMLENVATRERQGFDSFDALHLYVERLLVDSDSSLDSKNFPDR